MKKTQAILKKLNIVASSLEEMSFLQESNEIHKVFIEIVSNHNNRLAKEVFQIDLHIIQKFITMCDNNINLVKKYVKNQSGGNLFMYIPIYDF